MLATIERAMDETIRMEEIISLAKRRGFIFPAGELYGGLAGIYDYGPLGSLLKEQIKKLWRDTFVFGREDIFLIDAAIIMGEKALSASGHVGGFSDPVVVDTKTGKQYRADHLIESFGVEHAENLSLEEMNQIIKEKNILSPEGNALSEVKDFNLMLKTELGASADSSNIAYLRPETAQGIFVNYKNIMDSMHPKIPFGVAQIGKAYRNEITPRNFIFRLRELEQMEIEYFINPKDWEKYFELWRKEMHRWIELIGLDTEKVHEREVKGEDLAHYSQRTIDFEFDYLFGRKELYGLAYRTDYDLKKHSEASKTKLIYTDPHTGESFIPHVIEPSLGLDRTILATLVSAYREDEMDGKKRIYLALKHNLAPYRIAVSPLVKNKDFIVTKARDIFHNLKKRFGNVAWDDNGNIGKRYRRQDEIGTPFSLVVDYDTFEEGNLFETVSIRERDTGKQERVAVNNLVNYFEEKFSE